jgi:hypothetical protein
LSEIARNLDQAEQAALREGTIEQTRPEDNRNANANTSHNMDDSGISSKFCLKLINFLYFIKLFFFYTGFFSVQVRNTILDWNFNFIIIVLSLKMHSFLGLKPCIESVEYW